MVYDEYGVLDILYFIYATFELDVICQSDKIYNICNKYKHDK